MGTKIMVRITIKTMIRTIIKIMTRTTIKITTKMAIKKDALAFVQLPRVFLFMQKMKAINSKSR